VKIENLKSYLFIALKNNLLKKIIKRKKAELSSIDTVPHELQFKVEYSFQDQWIQSEIAEEAKQKLRAAIDNLSPRQKEIIFLKFDEGLDYPEIAKLLEITIESARKQLYRAIKSLRQTIDPEIIQNFLIFFSKKR
jgi:RNA polymerase sigma factor (sigma-70 family)